MDRELFESTFKKVLSYDNQKVHFLIVICLNIRFICMYKRSLLLGLFNFRFKTQPKRHMMVVHF